MAEIVDYDYIQEISTLDAGRNLASDTTNGYSQEMPGVNTFLINGQNQITDLPEGGTGISGWSTNVTWSASDYDTVAWSSGYIYMPDGTSLSISSGNTGDMSSMTYIYYDMSTNTMGTTTSAGDSVGENKILLCVASPTTSGKSAQFQAFGTGDQSTFITASNIAANTITANEIASNTITANEIKSGAITTNKIDAGAVTAGKIDVSKLSDIDPDLGSITAGNIKGVTITAGDTNSGAGIKLYPYTSSEGRMEFYYNGSVVGRINGGNYSGIGNAVLIYGGSGNGTIGLIGDTKCAGTLKIPVGTNLYN